MAWLQLPRAAERSALIGSNTPVGCPILACPARIHRCTCSHTPSTDARSSYPNAGHSKRSTGAENAGCAAGMCSHSSTAYARLDLQETHKSSRCCHSEGVARAAMPLAVAGTATATRVGSDHPKDMAWDTEQKSFSRTACCSHHSAISLADLRASALVSPDKGSNQAAEPLAWTRCT